MAWEKGRGLGKDEEDPRSRRRKEMAWRCTVNRWKAQRHFWRRRVPGRRWHSHLTGDGRSCSPSWRTDSLC